MNLKVCTAVLFVGCAILGSILLLSAPAHGTETQQNDSIQNLLRPNNADHPVVPYSHSAGSVTSEGMYTIGSDAVNHDGHTGKGIKVAVIDTGFDIDNPEISGNIAEYRSFVNTNFDIAGDDTSHGTASAEIVVDIAPDAELYLYSAYTDVEFLNLVDYLLSRGDIDIVSMSLGWSNDFGPANETSNISKKVNEARDSGILWINAAGNEAEQHWQGQFSDTDGDSWHNFQDDHQVIGIDVSKDHLEVVLSWWDSPLQDYELCLYEEDFFGDLVLLLCSENDQFLGYPPFEVVEYTSPYTETLYIAIKKYSATQDVNFQLFSRNHDLNMYAVASSSIGIPADASGSLSVGAIYWYDYILEPYSSQGPTLDGRIKPDIAAPTCVSTTTYGIEGYCGTSAAAPHAAGAAALAMQKYPSATADQVQILLESTTYSRHPKSNLDGTGAVDVAMLVGSDILALDNSNPSCDPCFFPETIMIQPGDTITWVNADNSPIRIAGGSGAQAFDSGNFARGWSSPVTFYDNDTVEYSDTLHPWASGRIIVGTGIPPSPELLSAAITGPNHVGLVFSEPVNAALGDFIDITLAGESTTRAFTALAGSGPAGITLTFDGPPAPPDATAVMAVGGGIGIAGSTLGEPFTVAVGDGQAPTLVSASVTGSDHLTVAFSEPVNAALADLASLEMMPGGTRNVIAISDSGTDTITVFFDGDLVPTDATAAFTLGSQITDMAGNMLTGQVTGIVAADGQAPNLVSVSIASDNANAGTAKVGDTVTLTFTASEGITGVSVVIDGAEAVATSSDLATWTAAKTVTEADLGGADVDFAINYTDMSSNPGVQVTGTTDGSAVTIAVSDENATRVVGTVFSDTNWNGVQDPGEVGMTYDKMLAIDYSNPSDVMEAITDSNGKYSFDVTPDVTTLIQAFYFPPGHVVFNPNTSWYSYVIPTEGQQIEFNIGFHKVTEEEQVELEIRTFLDSNRNGQRDAGEKGVEGIGGINNALTFFVYTYTIGPVAYPLTDSNGVAIIDDLVPADFALLVDVSNLADQGYYWTSTKYEKFDDHDRPFDPTYPVANDPMPGSRHVMEIGLSPG